MGLGHDLARPTSVSSTLRIVSRRTSSDIQMAELYCDCSLPTGIIAVYAVLPQSNRKAEFGCATGRIPVRVEEMIGGDLGNRCVRVALGLFTGYEKLQSLSKFGRPHGGLRMGWAGAGHHCRSVTVRRIRVRHLVKLSRVWPFTRVTAAASRKEPGRAAQGFSHCFLAGNALCGQYNRI